MNKQILSQEDYLAAIQERKCVCGHLGKEHNENGCTAYVMITDDQDPYSAPTNCSCKGFLLDTPDNRACGGIKQ